MDEMFGYNPLLGKTQQGLKIHIVREKTPPVGDLDRAYCGKLITGDPNLDIEEIDKAEVCAACSDNEHLEHYKGSI